MGMPEAFAAEIEAFLNGQGMDPATFGRRALKDPNFVFDVRRRGRCPNLRTLERVRGFMRSCAGEAGGEDGKDRP
jgi:hypothetical protein